MTSIALSPNPKATTWRSASASTTTSVPTPPTATGMEEESLAVTGSKDEALAATGCKDEAIVRQAVPREEPLLLPAPPANAATTSTTVQPEPPPQAADGTPPHASPETSRMRDWQFIVIKVDGHGLAGEIREGLEHLDEKGTSSAAWINVRAEQAERVTDYVVDNAASSAGHLHADEAGLRAAPLQKAPILGNQALEQYLTRTMKAYPAKHVMVLFEGHSREMRKHMDEIHGALEAVTDQAGRKIDIVGFDACFLAQAEMASEYKDVANVLVASQESMEGYRAIEDVASELDHHPMDPHALASHLVNTSTEFTLSAIDLEKMPEVEDQVALFSEALQKIGDQETLADVRKEILEAQHFYTMGKESPSPFRNAVDIVDAMERISANARLRTAAPDLVQAAETLAESLRMRPDGAVFAEKHVSETSQAGYQLVDARRAHGLSVFMPVAPAPFRDTYISFGDRRFAQSTGWNQAMQHLTSDRSPLYLAQCASSWLWGAVVANSTFGIELLQEKFGR